MEYPSVEKTLRVNRFRNSSWPGLKRFVLKLRLIHALRARRSVGRRGEAAAARYLESRGFWILARNWRYRRSDIDIVAVRDRYLVAVEVKTVSRVDGSAFDAIHNVRPGQYRMMIRLVEAYRRRHLPQCRRTKAWHNRGDLIVIHHRRLLGFIPWPKVVNHYVHYFC